MTVPEKVLDGLEGGEGHVDHLHQFPVQCFIAVDPRCACNFGAYSKSLRLIQKRVF